METYFRVRILKRERGGCLGGDIRPEQGREWLSYVLPPPGDFVPTLGPGVTQGKEGADLRLTNKEAGAATWKSRVQNPLKPDT